MPIHLVILLLMDCTQAQALASTLMRQHGLNRWTFGFNRQVRGLGICRYKQRRIELSVHYVQRNQVNHVRDTILHEIAHALAGPKVGHGPKWKALCQRLGCEPKATCRDTELQMPEGKWRATCLGCGMTYRRHRRPARRSILYCGKCGRSGGPLRWATTPDRSSP